MSTPKRQISTSVAAPAAPPALAFEGRDLGERDAPLVQTTLQRLLHDIMAGVYGPGHRIREEEVALRLGVSRAPVREALRVLEQDGLVELEPWKGARVVKLDAAALADLFELLGTMYGAVARLAVRHATDADLKKLFAVMDSLDRRLNPGTDFVKAIDLSFQMGAVLGECSKSTLADRMLRRLGRISYLSHSVLAPLPPAWLRTSRTRIAKLREALAARNEERSEKAARKLIRHTETLLLKRLAQQKD